MRFDTRPNHFIDDAYRRWGTKARRGVLMAITLAIACPQPLHADWGFVKVFDFADGYPGTGADIGVSGTNPTIHNDIVMFGISGSHQGIFRYERGSLISFADNGTADSFSSISVASSDAHDPYGSFVGNRGSGNGIYTRSIDNLAEAFPIATPSTPIPSGTGNFTSLGDHSIDAQRVTFIGFGSSSQRGIYAADVNSANEPSLVIKKFSNLPGGSFDTFQSFTALAHRNNTVVFSGAGSSNSGIYFRSISGFIVAFGTVADTNTNIPGRGATKFTFLQDPAYDGISTAFHGFGSGVSGVYTNQGGPLRTVADTSTAIPEATGNFTGIAASSVSIDDGDIAFEATGDNDLRGVYIEKDGAFEKVVATGDMVDGRTVSGVSIGRDGLSNGYLAMRLSFDDSGSTFYAAFSEHRWDPAGGAGGHWNSRANWPLGARPSNAVPTFIQPDGPALVQGPTTFTHMRSLTLGAQATGNAELHLQPTGQILIDETLTVQAAGKLTGNGALHATGGINNDGEIDLGDNSIALSGGLIDNHGLLRGNGQVGNPVTNHSDGEIRVDAGHTIRFTGPSNANSGKLRLNNGGTAEFTHTLTNTTSGQITGRGTLITDGGLNNNGQLNFSGGFTDVYGDVTMTAGSTTRVLGGSTTTFFDDVVNNGSITVDADSKAVFFGTTSGSGPFPGLGMVEVNGTLLPGNSPAIVDFGGSLTLAPTALLEAELAGTNPGSGANDHDQINITSNVTLDGTLDITLLDGFTPNYSDTFDILTYATRSGVFQQVTGHFISPVLALGQFYDDANGVLQLLATAPGDANGDLIVDISDFGVLAGNFNQPGTWETGDFDGDGMTTINDFGLLAANFNGDFNTLMAAAESFGITIPEPGTATLLGLAVLGVTTRRQR